MVVLGQAVAYCTCSVDKAHHLSCFFKLVLYRICSARMRRCFNVINQEQGLRSRNELKGSALLWSASYVAKMQELIQLYCSSVFLTKPSLVCL